MMTVRFFRYPVRLAAALCLCALAGMAFSAEESSIGTIESINQDQGYLVISGRELGWSEEMTEVYYDERRMEPQDLLQGMVVRYRVSGDGILQRLDILGPDDIVRQLEQPS